MISESASSTEWYCVRTQTKREHIAAGHLRELEGVEVFCPRLKYRKATRRYRLSSLTGGAKAGFTFLTNDGPALTIALARALDTERRPWTPGERRPLP